MDQTKNRKPSLSAIDEGNIPSRPESAGQQHRTNTVGAGKNESNRCGPPPPGEKKRGEGTDQWARLSVGHRTVPTASSVQARG